MMVVVVVLVNHILPLVDSRGDKKAHQKASFYGMSHLTSSNISPLQFLFLFWLVNVLWFYAYNISVIISCLHNQYL